MRGLSPSPLPPPARLAGLLLTAAALCLAPAPVRAQGAGGQMVVFGEYQVHYSVFNSGFLTAENAARYGVSRAPDRAVLNISVRKKRNGGSVPVAARVRATRGDLIHVRPLEFTEARERGAIYYLAQFQFRHRDALHFDVTVEPEGGAAHRFRFHQELHRDR